MGAVSTVPAFLDAMVTALKLRAGLSGVQVFTAATDALSEGEEAIVFGVEGIQSDANYPTMPMVRADEVYEVTGRVWIVKHGSGEAVIKAARDRAFAILDEVATEMATNDTMTGTVRDCRIVNWSIDQAPAPKVRDVRLAFAVRVSASFDPA